MTLALGAAGMSAVLRCPSRELSESLPVRPWLLRCGSAGAMVVLAMCCGTATCLLIDRPTDIAVRNLAACMAFAFASAVVIGATISWLLPLVLIAATWLYGLDNHSEPRVWAVLQYASTTWMTVAALALLVLTAALWVVRGARD